jgi:hypothetical protein
MPKSPGKKRPRNNQPLDDMADDGLPNEETSKDVDVVKKASKNEASLLRDLRRKRRDELRSKTTGTGLKIETNNNEGEASSNTNKHVVFDENDDDAMMNVETENKGTDNLTTQVDEQQYDTTAKDNVLDVEKNDDNDDEDDKVEEVKSGAARTLAMEQRAKERESEQLANQNKGRKKKKKTANISDIETSAPSATVSRASKVDDGDDGDLDPSFFAQVDAQLAEQRKQRREEKKRQPHREKPKGRHTVFASSDDDHASFSKPIPVDKTIELVVLGASSNERVGFAEDSSLLAVPLSQTAQLFSKSQLITSATPPSTNEKKKQTQKNAKKKNLTAVATWKRTRKMNEFAVPGAKSRKVRLQGKAAAQFKVK